MRCYDFDKTIYKKDSTKQLFLFALKKKPLLIFYMFKIFFFACLYVVKFIDLIKFKEIFFGFLNKFDDKDKLVSDFWDENSKFINKFYLEQKSANDIICSASPQFLVEPIMQKINPGCKVICTNLDVKSIKIIGENMKGETKNKTLTDLGYTEFDEVYTDSLSDFPILDMTENKFIVCGDTPYRFGEQKPTFLCKLKYIIKQLRIKHYIKNALIFLPLMFSGNFFNINNIVLCLFGFISFCSASSVVYIINDLADAKNDRNHKNKRKRPIASYMIKPVEAIILAFVLLAIICLIGIFKFSCDFVVLGILLSYIIVNLLYSFYLKRKPIVDVFTLSLCYLIRVLYGGAIVGIPVSKWLYLTVLCASLVMAFGKRRNENRDHKTEETRYVNKLYNYSFLDKGMYSCLMLCIVFYSLWVVEFRVNTVEYVNSIILLASIPMVMFILFKYCLNAEMQNNSGDPIEVLLKDKVLVLSSLMFVVIMFIAIYVPIVI